jgi:hypothetical protein
MYKLQIKPMNLVHVWIDSDFSTIIKDHSNFDKNCILEFQQNHDTIVISSNSVNEMCMSCCNILHRKLL